MMLFYYDSFLYFFSPEGGVFIMDKESQRPLDELIKEGIVEVKELMIVKKRYPMNRRFDIHLDGQSKSFAKFVSRNVFFYNNFETRVALEKGDVFVFTFNFECGSELYGPHFCVVYLDSNPLDQLVRVIPLHSLKEGKSINPASEIFLGSIPGVENLKQAVAMIGQTKKVDKIRLFDKVGLDDLYRAKDSENYEEGRMIQVQNKFKYRLTDEQYRKLRIAVIQYFNNGFIKH